jgi:hypothetical protein
MGKCTDVRLCGKLEKLFLVLELKKKLPFRIVEKVN